MIRFGHLKAIVAIIGTLWACGHFDAFHGERRALLLPDSKTVELKAKNNSTDSPPLRVAFLLFGLKNRARGCTNESHERVIDNLRQNNCIVTTYSFEHLQTGRVDRVNTYQPGPKECQHDGGCFPMDKEEIEPIVKDHCKPPRNCIYMKRYSGPITRNALVTLYNEYRIGTFLKDNLDKFDVAIALSSDFFLPENLSIEQIIESSSLKDAIYAPTSNDYAFITNGFYFGHSEAMMKLMSRWELEPKSGDNHVWPTDDNIGSYEKQVKNGIISQGMKRIPMKGYTCVDAGFLKVRHDGSVFGGVEQFKTFHERCQQKTGKKFLMEIYDSKSWNLVMQCMNKLHDF